MRRRWFRQLFLLVVLTFLLIVLGQQGAIAQDNTVSQNTYINEVIAGEVLSLVCVTIGVFAGSLLTVESRRWRTFFLSLLGIAAIASAIAAMGDQYMGFPNAHLLWVPAITGLSLGIVLIGSWWWGHRQGYTHALYVILLRPDKHDTDFEKLIERYEPSYVNFSSSLKFRKSLYYRAASARYRRLRKRPEINALYDLTVEKILADAQVEREKALKENRRQKIQKLLNDVDRQYSSALPVLSSNTLPPS